MSYHYDEEKRPTRLSHMRGRVEKAIKERLAPGRVEEEVNEFATQFIQDSVEKILGVAFGFDRRWGKEYEFHKGFETGAIAAKLNEMVASSETMKFVEDAIGDFKKHIKPVRLREWQKHYREHFLDAYWDQANKLIEVHADKYGREKAEEDFHAKLHEMFDTEADIPKGHPLRGDSDDEEDT